MIDFNVNSIKLFSAASIVILLFFSQRVIREDMARQKIPNALIMQFLKIGLAMYAALLAYGFLKGDKFAVAYTQAALTNAAVTLPLGYALWYFDLFSPGDAKYFTVLSLFIPLESYTLQYVPVFPALLVLINAYIIAFLSMFAYTIYLTLGKIPKAISEGYFSPKYLRAAGALALKKAASPLFLANLAGMLLCMATMLLSMRAINGEIQKVFDFPPGYFTLITVLVLYFAGTRVMNFIFSNKYIAWTVYVICACALIFLRLVLHVDIFHMIEQTVLSSFFIVVFIPIARKMIDIFNRAIEGDTVEHIRMEVILTEDTARNFKEKWGIDAPALVPLTDEQSQSIKDAVPNMEKITLVKHITFGPFIFAGAAFTIIFRHTIIHYLLLRQVR